MLHCFNARLSKMLPWFSSELESVVCHIYKEHTYGGQYYKPGIFDDLFSL